jgi:hypothetical protein
MTSFPRKPSATRRRSETLLALTFARLDRAAFGIAVGAWASSVIFVATAVLLIKSDTPLGPHLRLLGQYFPGYTVTRTGSFIGRDDVAR